MAESARFFIFHGPDEFTKAETLAHLKSGLGDAGTVELNTSYFDGRSVRLDELMHACNTVPFLAEKRLVIVEGLIEHASAKGRERERDKLLEFLPELPPSARLALVESRSLSPRDRFIKLANSIPIGYERLFPIPKGGALERWIVMRVKHHGGDIHPNAAAMLATDVGEDLRLLDMEIVKLLTYANYERPIEPADVDLLTPYAAQADIFALVDAIGQRRSKTASTLLRQKLEAGDEPLYLMAMVVRQIRLLIQVKEGLMAGERPDEIARRAKIHPYVAGKLTQQAGNFELNQLETIHRQLLDTDVAIKTGRIDPAVALDLLVAETSTRVLY
jgi:DNA polymerase-3 subunit delta